MIVGILIKRYFTIKFDFCFVLSICYQYNILYSKRKKETEEESKFFHIIPGKISTNQVGGELREVN